MLGRSQPHIPSFQWDTAGVTGSDDLQDNKSKQPGTELKPVTVSERLGRKICQEHRRKKHTHVVWDLLKSKCETTDTFLALLSLFAYCNCILHCVFGTTSCIIFKICTVVPFTCLPYNKPNKYRCSSS